MKFLLYVLKRLLYFIPVLLGLTIFVFVISRVLPGDPLVLFASQDMGPEQLEKLREQMGLNQPIWAQYWQWLTDLLRGDWGTAWFTSTPVLTDLKNRFPATFELTTIAMMITLLLGIPIGVISALYKDQIPDWIGRIISLFSFSVPLFWLGLMLIYLLYVKWHIAPPPAGRIDIFMQPPKSITGLYLLDSVLTGNWEAFRSATTHIVLPAITLAFVTIGPVARQTRNAMIDSLNSLYIRSALAAGLPNRIVYYWLALKNALIPTVTVTALIYGHQLAGSVVIEEIFSWPGIGRYALNAIVSSDYLPVQGFVILVSIVYVTVFLLADLVCFFLDPRIKY